MTIDTATPFVDATCSHEDCKRKDSYQMVGSCMNCKTDPIIGIFTKGHDAKSGWGSPDCPVCESRGHLYWRGLA